ncbi:MAG: cytochrome c, partial [Xanthomonadaceae bacterium]|nr:cytochrome c [Xanthomonadaceae bacterium]
MPALNHLSDTDVANVLSYINHSWGNGGASVAAAEVAARRGAQTPEAAQAGTKTPEAKYQGAPTAIPAPVALAGAGGALPPLSDDERKHATQIFFERCAGCHGVLRKGATGKPLTPDITRAKGTDYLKALINFGSPAGMPNWGTSGELSAQDIDIMARFLQHDPPSPPEWGMKEMKQSMVTFVPVDQR